MAAIALTAACGSTDAPSGDSGSPSRYAQVEAIVTRSCAFSATCHGGVGDGQANLNFAAALQTGGSIVDALTDEGDPRPACEYSAMPLLTPGNPDQSWFYIKLSAMNEGLDLVFEPDTTWDPGITRNANGRFPASECPLTEDGEIIFGRLMPWSNSEPMRLDAAELETIRAWITEGAPRPDDV